MSIPRELLWKDHGVALLFSGTICYGTHQRVPFGFSGPPSQVAWERFLVSCKGKPKENAKPGVRESKPNGNLGWRSKHRIDRKVTCLFLGASPPKWRCSTFGLPLNPQKGGNPSPRRKKKKTRVTKKPPSESLERLLFSSQFYLLGNKCRGLLPGTQEKKRQNKSRNGLEKHVWQSATGWAAVQSTRSSFRAPPSGSSNRS